MPPIRPATDGARMRPDRTRRSQRSSVAVRPRIVGGPRPCRSPGGPPCPCRPRQSGARSPGPLRPADSIPVPRLGGEDLSCVPGSRAFKLGRQEIAQQVVVAIQCASLAANSWMSWFDSASRRRREARLGQRRSPLRRAAGVSALEYRRRASGTSSSSGSSPSSNSERRYAAMKPSPPGRPR